ncbi:hypothetical protein [Micromonospora foliorum]|uniref:hypothetical protein n=1 Tax=Micromonospora foliorum TaxID=2911210 RepID=UPI001EE82526|nr:hypothetical protein [Micromonospora foliorum]MCG5440493.1 hypothetical protein [Micromonospora foliorum]
MRRDRTAAAPACTAVADALRPVAAAVLPQVAVVPRLVAVAVRRVVAVVVRRPALVVLAVGCTAARAVSPVARSRPGVVGLSLTTGLSDLAADATTTRPSTRTGSIPGVGVVTGATVTDRR